MKRILLYMIIGLFLISFVSAQEPDFFVKQGEDYNITFACVDDTQSFARCSPSTVCRISLNHVNSSTMVNDSLTTNIGNGKFRFPLASSLNQIIGEYTGTVCCDKGSAGTAHCEDLKYEVNMNGERFTTANGILYIILIAGAFFVFLIVLWGAIVLPIRNKRNGINEVIDVGFLKYIKVALMFLSYMLFVWVMNLFLTLSNGFSILTQYGGFFTMIFQVMMAITYPLLVIMFVVFFVMGANDLKLIKLLTMGIKPLG